MGKLENLKTADWINGTPHIITAAEAYQEQSDNHFFYMISWWGDEPAAFSPFHFTGHVAGSYEIVVGNNQHTQTVTALESDELVLLFEDQQEP